MEDGGELPAEVEAEPRAVRLRTSLQRLGLAIVAVAVIGVTSGYLFAASRPQSAAAARISAFVQVEAVGAPADELETWDPSAPTSGETRGPAPCGVVDESIAAAAQVAALAAGRVLVQYRPTDVAGEELAVLHDVAGDHQADVLLAPNPELADAVVATAWSRRLPLRGPEPDLLDGFATAYAGRGPDPVPCDRP